MVEYCKRRKPFNLALAATPRRPASRWKECGLPNPKSPKFRRILPEKRRPLVVAKPKCQVAAIDPRSGLQELKTKPNYGT